MDTDILKARSIELAERAYRLKERATDSTTKQKLDDAGDELIHFENSNRFYDAQTKLEADGAWTEDIRALAHEINVSHCQSSNQASLASAETKQTLETWAQSYQTSDQPTTKQLGIDITNALENMAYGNNIKDQKDAFNFLSGLLEALLAHLNNQLGSQSVNPTVQLLRNMRDSIIVSRELIIDKNELLAQDADEDKQVDRIELARQTLDDIYSVIQPVILPSD